AEALAALARGCEDALRADDPDRAAGLLAEADRRVGDGGGDDLRPRLDHCRADLAALRDLDRLGLTLPPETKSQKEFPARMAAAFSQWGLDGGADPGKAARRVAESPIRDRLVAALDVWLVAARPPIARAVLRAVDPDPYREAVRDAVAAGDDARVVELAGRPDALAQPAGFAVVLGQHNTIPNTRKRELLRAAAARWPGDAGVLMQLGLTYHKDPVREGEMVRWAQAAVAANPRNALTHFMLGGALMMRGDSSEASACFAEAVRLDPDFDVGWMIYADDRKAHGDWGGVRAAGQALVRLQPNEAEGHQLLASAAVEVGDLEAAVRHMRDAARLDPDPEYGPIIRATERVRDALVAVAAGREAPATPLDAVSLAAVYQKPGQRRYGLALRLYLGAFGAQPSLADPMTGHGYDAARAALRLAAGDDPSAVIGWDEWGQLHDRAYTWLAADLADLRRRAGLSIPTAKQFAATALAKWLADPDLALVRNPARRATMPAPDREQWEKFWAEVEAVRALAAPPPAEPPRPAKR
ncbi:MAG: hypothetical protein K2X82_03470, partial [Gemmataceae bacterium]|nr:hypothetical protein [Gemmataceae bacterium]